MSTNLALSAELRTEVGKADVRRLRRLAGMVPAIVYGGKAEPQNIKLKENEVLKAFSHEGIRSQVLELTVAGEPTAVIVKDSRAHPTKPKIMHIDFLRVDVNQPVTMAIPLHFIGEENAPGAKEGGVISHAMSDLEISGLPKHLPEFIEVDISGLGMGEGLHLSDIKLPANISLTVEIDEEHNPSVVHINQPKAEVEEEAPEGEEAAADDAAKEKGDAAADEGKE
jgi:large subunit ribosomal protein L25